MSDDRDIAAQFNEGIEPVLEGTPPTPDWESLQFESVAATGGGRGWWVAAVAAVVVLVVGAGSFLLGGRIGGNDEDAGPVGGDDPNDVSGFEGSIEGRWVLESWRDGDEWILVEIDVNTVEVPWIEFTADFEGERDSFISADGLGTAGTFEGWTGCNKIRPATYEYSAGFLNHGEVVVQAGLCDPNEAEQALLATLGNTPDGMEVIMGPDRMEWWGSNLEGRSYPLTFRRDGSPPPPTTEAPAPTSTVAPEGLAMRVYDVDGVEVVTPSYVSDLPEQVSRVEFYTTVIDSGNGPILCLWSVLDSLPPQCSGPKAAGLDMDGWSEESGGVRWGQRSVTVNWPALGSVLEVVDHAEDVPGGFDDPSQALPAECTGIELGAGAGPINEYARSLGDSNGGLFLANEGVVVLQVVGDPEPHREALAELGGACVVEVPRSENEQRSIQEALNPSLAAIPELLGTYGSSTGAGGRVNIWVPVADRATVQAIAALVEDPTAIRIIGIGVIHS